MLEIKEETQGGLSALYCSYICFWFLVTNDNSNFHHDNMETYKIEIKFFLKVSSINIFSEAHHAESLIFDLFLYEGCDIENNFLFKGFNF